MLKLSKERAYERLDDTDIKVAEQELDSLRSQAENTGKDMTYQFFLEDEKTIALYVYWNGEAVETYRF